MTLQSILYLFIIIIAAIISGSLSWYTWRNQQTTGAKPFSLMMLSIFYWSVTYLLQLTSPGVPVKIFWEKVTFLAVVAVPVLWLMFALEYTGRKDWISSPRTRLLFIVPLITMMVIWTNESNHLFWTTQDISRVGGLLLENSENGLWFWVHAAYSYVMILTGTVLIVRSLLRWPAYYRRQLPWILLAVAAPWLANAITVFKLLPILIDLTPFAFTVTGVGMAYALFRHRMLDLAPIARDVVIEGMQEAMIVLDASNQIVDINPAAQDILKLSGQQEPIGKRLAEILTTRPDLIERYQKVSEAQDEIELGEGENRRWYELTLSPLQDRRKNPIGRVILARDITGRKQTEQLLQENELRFRQIVENASDLIYRTDIMGCITYANGPVLRVLGYSREAEVLGKHYLDLTTPDSRKKLKHTYKCQLISGTLNTYHEFPTIAADGREVWLGQNVQLIMDGDKPTGFQAIARDITAIKQAQEALRIAYDQALEASRAKSQLVAKVSHELRTPLGGILGYAELLESGRFGSLQERQEKAVREILQSAEYLNEMIRELLDQAQIQANTSILTPREFTPAELLQKAASSTEILVQRKGLKFGTFLDQNLPQGLFGDDRRLLQILINLIGNAIKFTKNGEICVSLIRSDSAYWIMRVQDTGIGIPVEAQSSIFEPFQQASNAITRDNPGIGLGLSITKQLVDLMGGRIKLESQVGVGSTFDILLPIVKQPLSVERIS
jgi:PAS domain S-box-containing protein